MYDKSDGTHIYRLEINHVSGVYQSGSLRFYRDGVLEFSSDDVSAYMAEVNTVRFGIRSDDPNGIHTHTWDDVNISVQPVLSVISATVDLDPDTLNLKSKGKWVTAYIELPEDYDVTDIDVDTVTLEDAVPAEHRPTELGDYDDDGFTDLMVKFNRQALIEYLDGTTGEVTLTVSGELGDGTPFEGNNTITVINPGKN
jgi:hypothetical protein